MIHFRVASSALGEREVVYVHVYDSLAEMRAAATHHNGNDFEDAAGATQAWVSPDERAIAVVIRLARERLGVTVVSHEMHHAATALYGAHVGDRISRRAHLTHYNEPFAYLFSDLYGSCVKRMVQLGFY